MNRVSAPQLAIGAGALGALSAVVLATSWAFTLHVGYLRGSALALSVAASIIVTIVLLIREGRMDRARLRVAVGFSMAIAALPIAIVLAYVLAIVLSSLGYYQAMFPTD